MRVIAGASYGHKNTSTCRLNHIKAEEHLVLKVCRSSCFPNMSSQSVESWIDLSSQPSSSSLASPNHDEIITTGLQIRRSGLRRSRQLRLGTQLQPQPRSTSVAGSSQDEYEESESESDRVMSSSNEDVSNAVEDDDTQTALGVPTLEGNVFTPQPNAFSHPPQSRSVPASTSQPTSYFPPQPPTVASHRIPSNRVPTIQRPPITRPSSHITPDHDAALRASLTTLLSCANAVRKDKEPVAVVSRSNQPTTLRLVPESELGRRSPSRSPKLVPKRKSRESSKERNAKKIRAVTKPATADEVLLSPTMMTWFISAGVVLVFSAISFSAGYAWGKEVGRVEAQLGLDGATCGREAIRGSRTGLSKLRLTAVGA